MKNAVFLLRGVLNVLIEERAGRGRSAAARSLAIDITDLEKTLAHLTYFTIPAMTQADAGSLLCPRCQTPMVKMNIEAHDHSGWYTGFTCTCYDMDVAPPEAL